MDFHQQIPQTHWLLWFRQIPQRLEWWEQRKDLNAGIDVVLLSQQREKFFFFSQSLLSHLLPPLDFSYFTSLHCFYFREQIHFTRLTEFFFFIAKMRRAFKHINKKTIPKPIKRQKIPSSESIIRWIVEGKRKEKMKTATS